MPVSARSFHRAVRNVAEFGDTDVFPFPLENHWFYDDSATVEQLLSELDRSFDDWLVHYPVVSSRLLSGVGYAGFRAATQIDPIWNAYLLALTIEIAPDIENARIPAERSTVFSYRYSPAADSAALFNADLGWTAFQARALELAAEAAVVITTDISDFYPRIYHHRLQNALNQATNNTEVVRRIMAILEALSGGTSYGLPVGGHAARLLAELVLNRTDRLLNAHGVKFLRFVDDYALFADGREHAQAALVSLSTSLLANEGLSLSRAKTRFITSAEFTRLSPAAAPEVADSAEEKETRSFLRLRLRYDPYSPTADEDYEALSEELRRFDITRMLARELRKTRIDEALVRHLVKSLRFMEPEVRNDAILSLLQNLELLYPVFPTVAILLKALLAELGDATRDAVFDTLRALIARKSHIVLVPTNLAYALRIVAYDRSEETDAMLIALHADSGTDMMVKRDVILALTRRRVDYWLSAALKQFALATPWEKRALLVASFVLGDEGRHWRRGIKKYLTRPDTVFIEWVASKNSGVVWEVPM